MNSTGVSLNTCPVCGETYQPFVPFCFQDGEVLGDPSDQLPTLEAKGGDDEDTAILKKHAGIALGATLIDDLLNDEEDSPEVERLQWILIALLVLMGLLALPAGVGIVWMAGSAVGVSEVSAPKQLTVILYKGHFGEQLSIDGEVCGVLPCQAELTAGTHTMVVETPSGPERRVVEVVHGASSPTRLQLGTP